MWFELKHRVLKALRLMREPVFAIGLIRDGIPAAIEHMDILSFVRPRHLVDVGANRGQFAMAALAVNKDMKIDCFEPFAASADILERWARRTSPSIRVHRLAIAVEKGSAEFFVTSRDDSSSLLQPAKAQRDRGISVTQRIVVPTDRLDNVLRVDEIQRPSMLKIDVQGAELDVLKGAVTFLEAIDYIYLEISFIEIYEEQPLFAEIDQFLRDLGYELRGVANTHVDRNEGPGQADALYSRRD